MAATAATNMPSESASTSAPDMSSGAMDGATSPKLSSVPTQRGLEADSSRNSGYDDTNHVADLSAQGQRLSDLLGAADPARRARNNPLNNSASAGPLRPLSLQSSGVLHDPRTGEEDEFDSPELRALKALKWKNGRDLTAHIQDIALQQGKRAMVVTSGGSFKKFVCSSESPCPWLVNAVCTRPRVRKKTASETSASNSHEEERAASAETEESDVAKRKYWYVSSAYLLHTNCTGMAKPTARQLKDVSVLKQAVQMDAKISSASLVEQLKSHARLLCSKSMVYKAKTDLLDELEAVEDNTPPTTNLRSPATNQVSNSTHGFSFDIVQSTQQLPSYLARLSTLNPDVLHAVERDPQSSGHLWRAVAALDPNRFFSHATPLVFGVDSKQDRAASPALRVVADGSATSTQLVLLGCDGNLTTVTYAVALVPEPSDVHFTWFLSKLIECGYPLQRANAVFTDGGWPVTAACGRVGVQNMMQDTRYLIDDLSKLIERQLIGFQQQQHQGRPSFSLTADQSSCIWAAQRAESEGDFYAALHKLELSRPSLASGEAHQYPMPGSGVLAAQQLRSIDPRRWAVFPHHSTLRLYGWQTTRFSPEAHEDASRPLIPSTMQELRLPCEFFKTFALKLLNEAYHRNELATQWEREQRVVTPDAERLMQDEMKLVPLYEVAMSAPHIAFVWNPREGPQLRQCRVDLQEKTCTCGVRLQFGVPCRHILSVLRKMNALGQSFDYFEECYRVQTFVSVFKGHRIELPLDETVQADLAWLPPKHFSAPLVVPQGMSVVDPGTMIASLEPHIDQEKTGKRKRRVRIKPTDERKRPLYKCRRCNIADGHNSMTCPKRRNKP